MCRDIPSCWQRFQHPQPPARSECGPCGTTPAPHSEVSPCSGHIPSLSTQTPSKAVTREGNLQPFSLWGRKETIFHSLFQLLGAKYTSLLLLTVNTLEMPRFQAVLGCLFYLSLVLPS